MSVHSKLVVHAIQCESILLKYVKADQHSALLDHHSLAVLARAMMDASLMAMYISEPKLSLPQWHLRRHVLYLHDLNNRKRFLSAIVKTRPNIDLGFFENQGEIRADLLAAIRIHGLEVGLSEDEIEDLCKGQRVFTGGLNGAVREAGWSVSDYEFIYSYFSAFVHTHPVSFLRDMERGVSYSGPSDFQVGFVHSLIGFVAGFLSEANTRVQDFCADGGDPLGFLTD
jgi:hypothetical protein